MINLICGYQSLNGNPIDRSRLEHMAAAMIPAGHDAGMDIMIHGNTGFAVIGVHKPNPFTKDEYLKSPEIYNSSDLMIAADISLYNIDELSRHLDVASEPLTIVAALYRADGMRGLDALNGDFTLALYDKVKGELLFKRDHVGIRPAYYAFNNNTAFIFGSLGKAVRANGLIKTPVNQQAQIDHLVQSPKENVSSFHHNLCRLPGGQEAVLNGKNLTLSTYWRLEPQSYPDPSVSFEDWTAEYKRLFQEAIRKRLPKSGSVASHLSSGLDSASIAAMASRILPDESQILDSYTYAMAEEFSPEEILDETVYAGYLAKSTNRMAWTKIHKSYDQNEQPIAEEEDRNKSIKISDPEEQTARMSGERGTNVILSGWGGDEVATYTGTGVLTELLFRGNWRAFRREVKLYAEKRNESFGEVLFKTVGSRLAPNRVVKYFKSRSQQDELSTLAYYSGFKKELCKPYGLDLNYGQDSQKNRQLKFEKRNLQWALEEWAYTGARHGVRYAFPMLDIEFLKYAISCPPQFLIRGGYNRAPMRAAMRDILPREILENRWKHISDPCANIHVIRKKDEYLAELRALSNNDLLKDIFDFDAIEQRILSLPSEQEERSRLADWSRIGEQGFDLAEGIVTPIDNMKKYLKIKTCADAK